MSKVDDQEPIVAVAVEPGAPVEALQRFVQEGDEAAFAQLVERYGSLVFSLCRRVLQHEQDAEDAFQATFLVLARKAGTIGKHGSVGSWLYRVAYRIARDLKGKRARLPVHAPTPIEPAAADDTAELVWRDLRPVLDDAVNSLPAKHRAPFVLCYFEGKSNEQAALELGVPVGTVASRLSRARDWLRRRLKHRGVALSVGALAMLLLGRTRANAAPPELARATTRDALRFARRKPPASDASGKARSLAESFLRTQQRNRVLILGGLLLAIFSITATVGLLIFTIVQRNRTDQERIQGVWAADFTQIGGQVLPSVGSTITFQDNHWQLDCLIFGPDNKFTQPATFELKPASTPTQIDIIDPMGNRWPGIYELKDDTLKICFNWGGSRRPKEFTSPPGSMIHLYHLRRER